MKRYIVFLLLLLSIQVLGENSCKILNIYKGDSQIPITEITYRDNFDMELVINYNPLEQLTDKLQITLQLPASNYIYGMVAALNAPPKTISYQYANASTNQYIFEVTGFDKTQPSTFTVTVYHANIASIADCDPHLFSLSTSMKYYDSNNLLVDFPGQFSYPIYGKHKEGILSAGGSMNYSAERDANQPVYIEMSNYASDNTYTNSNVLLHFDSNIPIKKVTSGFLRVAPTTTVGSKLYYILPKNSSFRIYFDLPESSNTLNLVLSGDAMFEGCTAGTVFPIDPITYSFTGKPDNQILSYPSIFSSYNYENSVVYNDPCNPDDFAVTVFLDNIYNSAISTTQPIVLVYDIPTKFNVRSLEYNYSTAYPEHVYYRLCGNSTYESTPLVRNGNKYTLPAGVNVDKLRVEFLNINAETSALDLTIYAVTPAGTCTNTNTELICTLLKNNDNHISKSFKFVPPGYDNSIGLYYAENILLNDQEIKPEYLNLNVLKTLKTDDQFVYTLSENMSFTDDPHIELSFNTATFLPAAAFNATYFNASPITFLISADRKKLTISNLTINGFVNTCNTQYQLFVRVTTKVAHRPTVSANVNTLSLQNKDGVGIAYPYYYYWSVASTQSVNNNVFFSCNGGVTRSTGITIKKDDAVNVYYTLENTTLYKYDQKAFVFYCTLPTTAVLPALSLLKTATIGNITIPSIIPPNSYEVTFASGDLEDYQSLAYTTSATLTTNILKVRVSAVTLNAYEKIMLALAYPSSLGLTTNNDVRFYAEAGDLLIPPQSSSLVIGPKSDCDLFDCVECITSFSPIPGKEYLLSAWVKESYTGNSPLGYVHSGVRITFNNGADQTLPLFRPAGPVVDGWQRIESPFMVPSNAANIQIILVNEHTGAGANVFFDDIRIHPYNSNMKSFVYDPSTQKLTAELDENNFATLYEYDDEGILIRVKKETERGVMTIKETRSNQSKIK